MKGNKKILAIAVLLLLIAVSYTTYAIYKTSVAGNAEVTAAKWEVAFKNGATTLEDTFTVTFGEDDCKNNAHVKDGKIAPGATCTKKILLDAAQTEVDVTYNATVDNENITATSGNTENANEFTVELTPATGTIEYGDATRTKELTLTVTWAGTDDSEADPADTINKADTGLQGATITVPVTLVAKQVVGA